MDRRVRKVLAYLEYLVEAEATHALGECNDDEDVVIDRFTGGEGDYLAEVRRKIAESYGTSVMGAKMGLK